MTEKIVIVLEAEAIMEINQILIDKDKEQALEFIRKHIEPALHHEEHGKCGCGH
jgi:hypothetical protein